MSALHDTLTKSCESVEAQALGTDGCPDVEEHGDMKHWLHLVLSQQHDLLFKRFEDLLQVRLEQNRLAIVKDLEERDLGRTWQASKSDQAVLSVPKPPHLESGSTMSVEVCPPSSSPSSLYLPGCPELDPSQQPHVSSASFSSAASGQISQYIPPEIAAITYKRTSDLERLVGSESDSKEYWLDVAMSTVIIVNTIILFVQSQWRGWEAAVELGLQERRGHEWEGASTAFYVCDHICNAIFVVELFVRLGFHRHRYLCDPFNVFDMAIVLATSIDAYVLQPFALHGGQNLTIARLARILRVARIFRVFRIIRVAKHLSQLRVMITALSMCYNPLVWSMLILTVIVLGSGIFISQIVADFVMDDKNDLNTRQWVFEFYGNAAKASYTMFEVTFSGSWPSRTKPLIDEVSAWFCLFCIAYQVVIAFAILRIIGAIFLNETIRAANNDSEMLVMSKLKEKEEFSNKLREFFIAADTSGDGRLSFGELQDILSDPGVSAWLKVLELEIYEVMALFRLLDDNADGTVSYDEFLGGTVRLKGNARAIDSILLMHEQHKMGKAVETITESVSQMTKDIAGLSRRTAKAGF